MTATTQLQGRLGNNFYQIATCVSYAIRNRVGYYIPKNSPHMPDGKNVFNVASTGDMPEEWITITEPTKEINGTTKGVYIPIPDVEVSVQLKGYWQSFRYFDGYRNEILQAFNIPYKKIDAVSIHVRRGDYLRLSAFEVLPITYYEKSINYFKGKGYDTFYVFSDDLNWCKENFTNSFGVDFLFIEGGTELNDLTMMSCCEHNIVANSSFSFVAAWLNQNKDKIVLCPDETYCWFNTDYIPDYYTVIQC